MNVVVLDFERRRNQELVMLYGKLLDLAKQGVLMGAIGCVMDQAGREHPFAVGVYRDPGRASNAGFRIQQGAANSDSMF